MLPKQSTYRHTEAGPYFNLSSQFCLYKTIVVHMHGKETSWFTFVDKIYGIICFFVQFFFLKKIKELFFQGSENKILKIPLAFNAMHY